MRLKKSQKEALLRWLGEGKKTDEINALAAKFDPPFKVTRANVSKYRKTRNIQQKAISAIDESTALKQGYALREYRIMRLSQFAELLAADLFGGFLWVDQVKSIGNGLYAEKVEYEEFNKAEAEIYLKTLDDIALEMGERTRKVAGPGEGGAFEHIIRKIGVDVDDI